MNIWLLPTLGLNDPDHYFFLYDQKILRYCEISDWQTFSKNTQF